MLARARGRIRIRRAHRLPLALTPITVTLVCALWMALGTQLGSLASSALAQTATSANATDVRITDSGFDPPSVTINVGDTIHWTNTSTQTHTVTSADGLFDSAALSPGSGFSITLAIPGTHAYTSLGTASFAGTVRVLAPGLSGAPTDPANVHLPRMDFPRIDPLDVGLHPRLGAVASRTRILLGFTSSATWPRQIRPCWLPT